jgi:hypothetical protein
MSCSAHFAARTTLAPTRCGGTEQRLFMLSPLSYCFESPTSVTFGTEHAVVSKCVADLSHRFKLWNQPQPLPDLTLSEDGRITCDLSGLRESMSQEGTR